MRLTKTATTLSAALLLFSNNLYAQNTTCTQDNASGCLNVMEKRYGDQYKKVIDLFKDEYRKTQQSRLKADDFFEAKSFDIPAMVQRCDGIADDLSGPQKNDFQTLCKLYLNKEGQRFLFKLTNGPEARQAFEKATGKIAKKSELTPLEQMEAEKQSAYRKPLENASTNGVIVNSVISAMKVLAEYASNGTTSNHEIQTAAMRFGANGSPCQRLSNSEIVAGIVEYKLLSTWSKVYNTNVGGSSYKLTAAVDKIKRFCPNPQPLLDEVNAAIKETDLFEEKLVGAKKTYEKKIAEKEQEKVKMAEADKANQQKRERDLQSGQAKVSSWKDAQLLYKPDIGGQVLAETPISADGKNYWFQGDITKVDNSKQFYTATNGNFAKVIVDDKSVVNDQLRERGSYLFVGKFVETTKITLTDRSSRLIPVFKLMYVGNGS